MLILLLETTIRTENDNRRSPKGGMSLSITPVLEWKKKVYIDDSNAKERNRSKKLYKRLNLAMTGGASFDSSMDLDPPKSCLHVQVYVSERYSAQQSHGF